MQIVAWCRGWPIPTTLLLNLDAASLEEMSALLYADDHEMLSHGLILYDALYAWCKECQGESHNWPPQM